MTSVQSRGAIVPDPSGPPPKHLKPLKKGARQREAEKKKQLKSYREELPYLTSVETFEYRNSYFETLCTSILADGYHRTFTEIFHLVKLQRRQREEAGRDSMLWQICPLEEEVDKLKTMSRFLMLAESYERKNNHLEAYEAYLQLARYFEEDSTDKWLSDHYYQRCLSTAPQVEGDEGRKLAEANFNIGLAMQNGADLEGAMEHFDTFYNMTKGHDDWLQKDGKSLHRLACEHLAEAHVSRSEQVQDSERAKNLLQTAYNIAKESGNNLLQATTANQLGAAFDKIDKPDTALHFYKEFYQLATKLEDSEQLGLACEALANAYEKQGNSEQNLKFLEEFAAVTEGKHDKLFSRACRGLGAAFNKKGDYQKAADYFSKAFSVARTLQDKEDIYLTRMQFGISQAFSFLTAYNEQLRETTQNSIANLLTWKEVRKNDELKKELSDKPPATLQSRRPKRKIPSHVQEAEDAAAAESSRGDNAPAGEATGQREASTASAASAKSGAKQN